MISGVEETAAVIAQQLREAGIAEEVIQSATSVETSGEPSTPPQPASRTRLARWYGVLKELQDKIDRPDHKTLKRMGDKNGPSPQKMKKKKV
jgi:hypothetical protein